MNTEERESIERLLKGETITDSNYRRNDYAIRNNILESLFDPTPLSLDVLRRELGEPHGETWGGRLAWGTAAAYTPRCIWDDRNSTLEFVSGLNVTTLGQLRRILSVIRETAAGGEASNA